MNSLPTNPTAAAAAPAIYIDTTGQLVSQVSVEQVLAVLGPIVDQLRAQAVVACAAAVRREGPFSALYGIRYHARTLDEARTIADGAFQTASKKAAQPRKHDTQ